MEELLNEVVPQEDLEVHKYIYIHKYTVFGYL